MQITRAGVKSWLFRYMLQGKARGMGLGPLHTVGLAEARSRALSCRKQILDGFDPIDEKKAKQVSETKARISNKTFSECATPYIEAHKDSWKSTKHADQWRNTIATYADPLFKQLPTGSIDTTLVIQVIEPIWREKTETATRLRGRIESVLDWATVRDTVLGRTQQDGGDIWTTSYPKDRKCRKFNIILPCPISKHLISSFD